MPERDFHFEYENSIPVKKKPENRKKPKPSPPINSRRNPSVAVNNESPYDDVPEEATAVNTEDLEVIGEIAEPEPEVKREEEAFFEEDVKIYSRSKPEEKPPAKSKKLIAAAVALAVIGACFLAAGIYFGIKYFNLL